MAPPLPSMRAPRGRERGLSPSRRALVRRHSRRDAFFVGAALCGRSGWGGNSRPDQREEAPGNFAPKGGGIGIALAPQPGGARTASQPQQVPQTPQPMKKFAFGQQESFTKPQLQQLL